MFGFKSIFGGSNREEEEIEDESVSDSSRALWKKKDEMLLLTTFLSYRAHHNADPSAETHYMLVKDSVSFEGITKEKTKDKLTKMKKNYWDSLQNPASLKHQGKEELYSLCSEIWGKEKGNKKMRFETGVDEERDKDLFEKYPMLMNILRDQCQEHASKVARDLGDARALELENRWRAYLVKREKAELERVDLVKETRLAFLSWLEKLA